MHAQHLLAQRAGGLVLASALTVCTTIGIEASLPFADVLDNTESRNLVGVPFLN
jgi:hypothetical protein